MNVNFTVIVTFDSNPCKSPDFATDLTLKDFLTDYCAGMCLFLKGCSHGTTAIFYHNK